MTNKQSTRKMFDIKMEQYFGNREIQTIKQAVVLARWFDLAEVRDNWRINSKKIGPEVS